MDIRQSSNYSKYMESLGWKVEKAGLANVFIRHLPLVKRYSVIKIQRPQKMDFEKLDVIAKAHHSLFVKVEPDVNFQFSTLNSQFRKDSWPLLPSKTLILDLKKTVLGNLPKDTRYEIRKAQEKKLVVKKSDDIELFYKLLQQTMKIGKWDVPIHNEVASLWKSFQPENSQILLTYHDSEVVAGCLLIWDHDTAHYMYAALNQVGRQFGAAYFLMWETIKFCNENRLKFLDLEGIYDERFAKSTKNWIGFTKFKMGWGGKTKEYEGAFTKYFNGPAKMLFSIGELV